MTFACIMRLMPATPIADKQAADRRRDQAHEQRDQCGERDRRARLAHLDGEQRERQQRDDDDQEDQRQRDQQDGERDLVGRLLALGRLDHRDHAVEERLAGIDRDAHDDPVGQHARAAGHGGEIAARFADDRRRLAGDGALVDRGDALDHLAVGRDGVVGLDQHHVALAQILGLDERRLAATRAFWTTRLAITV